MTSTIISTTTARMILIDLWEKAKCSFAVGGNPGREARIRYRKEGGE